MTELDMSVSFVCRTAESARQTINLVVSAVSELFDC